MSNFKGYLLKFGDTVFPHKYLAQDPTLTPYQRTEAEAYRDANNDLHRITINNHKTKMEFTTKDGLTLEDKLVIKNAMDSGLINEVERKYRVTYWNDDINDYSTGDFYVSDVSYVPHYIDRFKQTVVYKPITFTLIEY